MLRCLVRNAIPLTLEPFFKIARSRHKSIRRAHTRAFFRLWDWEKTYICESSRISAQHTVHTGIFDDVTDGEHFSKYVPIWAILHASRNPAWPISIRQSTRHSLLLANLRVANVFLHLSHSTVSLFREIELSPQILRARSSTFSAISHWREKKAKRRGRGWRRHVI